MEVPFPLRNPLSCTTALRNAPQPKASPFLVFLPTRPFKWRINQLTAKTYQITAGFSRKKKRKSSSSTPKFKYPPVKGFAPRTQASTTIKRKDQKKNEENEEGSGSLLLDGSGTMTDESTLASDDNEGTWTLLETKACEVESDDKVNGTALEASSSSGSLFDDKISLEGNGQISQVNGQSRESMTERITMNEGNVIETGPVDASAFEMFIQGKQAVNGSKKSLWHDNLENGSIQAEIRTEFTGNVSIQPEQDKRVSDVDNTYQSLVKSAGVNGHYSSTHKVETNGENFLRPKLECPENDNYEAQHRLAEDNFRKGNKLFNYPELVKPGQQIELFFNRSFSTLKNENDVVIMGAFNDWKWKPFNIKLSKSHFKGDWWSCKIHVPKEVYNIDFVFCNGKNVYDNNYEQDYCITVDGGLDELGFENFLLEEKRKEQEEIARQKAEKRRQEEEERRKKEDELERDADKTRAKQEVAKRRLELQELTKDAPISIDGIWYIQPREFKGNDRVRLYYNKNSGPLSHSTSIWIHGGYNNWKDGPSIISKLIKSHDRDGDWWHAEFVVPDQAVVLNWVFADDPPKQAIAYDNNYHHDFRAIVPASIPQEPYWVEEELNVFQRLQIERQLKENARRAKAEKTARLKAETKKRTLKAFLLSQKHIVYTDPIYVRAGSTVTLFYNPANTVLNGKSEIWLRCSFNRWTHQSGPLPPKRMILAENGSHLKALVEVPIDAYMMDFVFSDKKDGGIYDNKNCMDYHIAVYGGAVKEPPMHIVHVSTEMAPIAKVGGLGDVVTSLSRAIQGMDHNVDIILPKYDCLDYSHVKDLEFRKSYSLSGTEIKVWTGKVEGLSVYFLEPLNGYFWDGCIYGCGNDAERFGFFCHAALEFLLQNGFNPDIIHCHDWPTAPVSWLFKEQYMKNGLHRGRVVFTIHNLEFGTNFIGKAMEFTDRATTVSPTYAQEVSGNRLISPHLYKFHGILNGIDPDIWDPYNDSFIPVPYTSDNVVEGKRAAKDALQQRLKLKRSVDRPLVGIITRLTQQKGIHLIKHAIWRTLERGGQVVLLGSAPDPHIQNEFLNLANQLHTSHQDWARLCLTYDEPLSHLIYAGADFILVPSIFEPCGLTQLIAMRYGSIPVVRKTGGLQDTVFDVNHEKGRAHNLELEPNGFCFDNADPAGLDYGLNRALSSWYDRRDWFNRLCKCVMEQDWSWNRPALDYLELYHVAHK